MSSMTKRLKLKIGITGKLATVILAAFFLTFSFLIFLVYNEVRLEIIDSTKREHEKLAHALAAQVEIPVGEAMTVARTLAGTMEADIRGSRSLTRDEAIRILHQILDANPNVIGSYVAFEPNAFDGRDNEFKNTPGHDATGRFIPYVNKLSGSVKLDPLLDYEQEGIGDYYLLPKKTGKETLLEPYLYEGVLLTSLVVPIKDAQGRFQGIAGVDLSLGTLDTMVSQIKILDTGNAYLVSNQGAYLSYPNKLMIGYSSLTDIAADKIRKAYESGVALNQKTVKEADVSKVEKMEQETTPEIMESLKTLASEVSAGKSGIINTLNRDSGLQQWTFYIPIKIGRTDNYWSLLVNVPPDEALAPLSKILKELITVAIGSLILIAVLVVVLVRRVTRPVGMTVNMLRDIAQGEGDLTKRIQVTSDDETGELAKYFNLFVDKLSGIIRQVSESVQQVEHGSSQLAAGIDQQSIATNQVTAVISQVAEGANNQREGVATVRESISQLSSAITQIATGAHEQASGVEETSRLSMAMLNDVTEAVTMIKSIGDATTTNTKQAARGSESVRAVVKGMDDIQAAINQGLANVNKLGEGSSQIGAIIEVINDIADQTNLLALNAAIEAARAGEHGKGFAVVAGEVRNLAEKAKNSTHAIAQIIKELSVAINSTIEAVQLSGEQVKAGNRLAGEAVNFLQGIEQTASETVNSINNLLILADKLDERSKSVGQAMINIAAITEENSASAVEMTADSDRVVEIIADIATVGEENAASAVEVASLAEEQSATLKEMTSMANTLAKTATKLKELVGQFKT